MRGVVFAAFLLSTAAYGQAFQQPSAERYAPNMNPVGTFQDSPERKATRDGVLARQAAERAARQKQIDLPSQ